MKIKEIINECYIELLNEGVDLKSKTDKGNRLFKMLKTAKFQHYDSPKGELSEFYKGEEDRKRLVSKLNKEDKAQYKKWITTDDGIKSLELFKQYSTINENKTIVDKFGDILETDSDWPGLKFPVKGYKTHVKDHIVNIICNVDGISEKSFNAVDETIKKVKDMFDSNPNLLDLINKCEKAGYRFELAAEMLYQKMFK
jgi:hypothetical protein